MPTRYKGSVYYNLKESKYSISVNGIEYFFSSKYNMNRFKNRLNCTREEMKQSFVLKKYPITELIHKEFDLTGISDLNVYMEVEKRGFCVRLKGVFATWQDVLVTILQNEIKNSYQKSIEESEANKED